MDRHIEKHDCLESKSSAKILSKTQSNFTRKGIKLVRMVDIQNIFGELWYSIDGRRMAYK